MRYLKGREDKDKIWVDPKEDTLYLANHYHMSDALATWDGQLVDIRRLAWKTEEIVYRSPDVGRHEYDFEYLVDMMQKLPKFGDIHAGRAWAYAPL
jgi:hypothetical protein